MWNDEKGRATVDLNTRTHVPVCHTDEHSRKPEIIVPETDLAK
jgi:hypothetical protein